MGYFNIDLTTTLFFFLSLDLLHANVYKRKMHPCASFLLPFLLPTQIYECATKSSCFCASTLHVLFVPTKNIQTFATPALRRHTLHVLRVEIWEWPILVTTFLKSYYPF